MFHPIVSHARAVSTLAASLAILGAASGCGGHNHLSEYNFESRSLAVVYIAPPRPVLLTGWYDVAASDPVTAVVARGVRCREGDLRAACAVSPG